MANHTNLTETSREHTGNSTVRTVYKSGNTELIVKSSFIGGESLEDLLYEIIKHKLDNHTLDNTRQAEAI